MGVIHDCWNDTLRCGDDQLNVASVRIRTAVGNTWCIVDGSYELDNRDPLGGENLRLPRQ